MSSSAALKQTTQTGNRSVTKRKPEQSEDLQAKKQKRDTKEKKISIGDIVQSRCRYGDRWVVEEGLVIAFDNTILTYQPKKRRYEDDGSIEYVGDVFCETQVNVDNSHLKVLRRVEAEQSEDQEKKKLLTDLRRVHTRMVRLHKQQEKQKRENIKQILEKIEKRYNLDTSINELCDSYHDGCLRVYGNRNRVLVRKMGTNDEYEVILPPIPLLPFHRYCNETDTVALRELTRDLIRMYPRLGDKEWYKKITTTAITSPKWMSNIIISYDKEDTDITDCIISKMLQKENAPHTYMDMLWKMGHLRAKYMYQQAKEFSPSHNRVDLNECYTFLA